MAANNDILELVLQGTYGSASLITQNVFHYEIHVPSPFVLSDYGTSLIDEWNDHVMSVVQNVISSNCGWQQMTVRNLTDTDEIFISAFTEQLSGAVTGDCLPPYASWGFLYRRSTTATRNGYKRFCGVPESSQINGEPTAGAAIALQSVALHLSNSFTLTLEAASAAPDVDVEFVPVIVRKDATGALITSQNIVAVQPCGIGTQNSRKFGRGM